MTKKTVSITDNTSLVLEGGGMRGIFTIGVLDNFMDRGIRFPYIKGVSAGACSALSYLSGQRGRAKYINTDLLKERNYISPWFLLTKRNIMDFDFLFHELPEKISPYRYDVLAGSKERYEVVTTSCITGKACYFEEKQNPKRVIDIVKASSSLPFVCPIAYVDGEPMADGGVADSIPVERALEMGFDKPVIVLTRNKGYRKPGKPTRVPFFMYRKYPKLKEAIRSRNAIYNRQIELVERMEQEGRAIVIRPERPIDVGRMERNIDKIEALYNEGYNLAASIDFKDGGMFMIDRIKKYAQLDWKLDECHGMSHWERVERNGLLLATDEVNKTVVRLFAYLHDKWRIDNGEDMQHGLRAAANLSKLRDTLLSELSDEEFDLLRKACELHTVCHRTGNITIDTCFDADRLDLPRVNITPDPKKMATERGAHYAADMSKYRKDFQEFSF